MLRGWLNADTLDAFKSIVETERYMRRELVELDKKGQSLKSWRREFILGANMKATRSAVVTLMVDQMDLEAGFKFRQVQLYDPGVAASYDEMRDRIQPYLDQSKNVRSDHRSTGRRNRMTNIPLPELIGLLLEWPMTASERSEMDKLLVALKVYNDKNPHLDANLYLMDGLEPRRRSRNMKTNPEERNPKFWKVINLQVGSSNGYVGDFSMRTSDAVSVQIHHVIPKTSERDFPDTLALAISWPTEFSRSVILQKD